MPAVPTPTAFGRYLRTETAGGLFLLAAAALALLAANTPLYEGYVSLRDFTLGPAALNLDLTIGTWAQDALLAVFFFIAGIELKRELVLGELADRRKAALPILAAFGGVAIPALVALSIGWGTPGIDQAWAIPVATDIAFALGVLSLTASRIPASARVFLLSLAVVDDLVAIAIIAIVFTATIAMAWLVGAVVCLIVYAMAQRRRITTPFLYVPLAIFTWVCMFQSGVHATVAGVAIGLLTRVLRDKGEEQAPADRLVRRIQPWSAGLCVPLFAFFAAGVHVNGTLLQNIAADRIAIGIIVGLVVGKTVGIFGTGWLAMRFGLATRPQGLENGDMFALAVLGGIGFTVSLLVAELSLTGLDDDLAVETAKAAVLIASIIAAVAGSFLISRRGKHHKRLATQEPQA